jgi:SAM-dependent methyltransferase
VIRPGGRRVPRRPTVGRVAPEDPVDLVRRGYDALSRRYERAYPAATKYRPWLESLTRRLAPRSTVLDLGCGSGVPVSLALSLAGHRVVGVDVSEVQVARARELVPAARFHRADLATVDLAGLGLGDGSLDAVVCFYALIHVPVERHPAVLARIAGWLRPGGWLDCTLGATAWTGVQQDWLGGGVPMWWSHADAVTNRRWLGEAGFLVEHEEFVPEGDSGAVLFRARRPPAVRGRPAMMSR